MLSTRNVTENKGKGSSTLLKKSQSSGGYNFTDVNVANVKDVQRNSKTHRSTKSAKGKLENILWKKVKSKLSSKRWIGIIKVKKRDWENVPF